MKEKGPSFAVPAGLFIGARLASMVVGLAMIPLLIHFLGGIAFATWAILLSCSVVFAELQLGIPTALMRQVAGRTETSAAAGLWSSAAAILLAVYLGFLPLVIVGAFPLGEWLRLPPIASLRPGAAIIFIYLAVAVRAVMLTGTYALLAAFRFRYVAALSLAQALVSNTTASAVAALTGDLGYTLSAFWTAQVVVVAVSYFFAQHDLGWRPRLRLAARPEMRVLLAYGVKIQLGEWAQTINFQADKFIIVRLLGLWPAALYEVANRSTLALRSIPASGMTTFLPIAAQQTATGADVSASARRMAAAALYSVFVLFAVPLTIAPVFLYAWVGEMGYVSRHVFTSLAVGAASSLLVRPVAALAQASGHEEIPARAALVSILVNVPLSLLLVRVWGVGGAALGSSIAMVLGSVVLLREARSRMGRPVIATMADVVIRDWPLAAVCLAFGMIVHFEFGRWFLAMPLDVRYGMGPRMKAGLLALALYVVCLLLLAVVKARAIGLDDSEREVVSAARSVLTGGLRRWAPPGRSVATEDSRRL